MTQDCSHEKQWYSSFPSIQWNIPWWFPRGCSSSASMMEFWATKYLKCCAAASLVSKSGPPPPQVLQCLKRVSSSSKDDNDSAPHAEGNVPTCKNNLHNSLLVMSDSLRYCWLWVHPSFHYVVASLFDKGTMLYVVRLSHWDTVQYKIEKTKLVSRKIMKT